jgi:hypothetical protein
MGEVLHHRLPSPLRSRNSPRRTHLVGNNRKYTEWEMAPGEFCKCSGTGLSARVVLSPEGRQLRIATFNINNVNKRLQNLVAWLAGAQPDVVCR